MDVDGLRSLLQAERVRVSATIEHLHEANSGSIEDETEEETYDNHLADSASATLDREIDYTLEGNSEQILAAVDQALERIEAGTFGKCERCGKQIAKDRLEAIPYATRCIDCQRLVERG